MKGETMSDERKMEMKNDGPWKKERKEGNYADNELWRSRKGEKKFQEALKENTFKKKFGSKVSEYCIFWFCYSNRFIHYYSNFFPIHTLVLK